MKSIHIRDVPEVVIARLKLRAQRHHRSLQGELKALLTEASAQVETGGSEEFTRQTVKTPGVQNWSLLPYAGLLPPALRMLSKVPSMSCFPCSPILW